MIQPRKRTDCQAVERMYRDSDIRITRSIRMGEIRLNDLDDSVTPDEIKNLIAFNGECLTKDIKVGIIKITTRNGLGITWVRCPFYAAIKFSGANPNRMDISQGRTFTSKENPVFQVYGWRIYEP